VSVPALALKIETPAGNNIPCRGFYQQEEDSLFVQVGAFNREQRYFSSLESDKVRFDLDKKGKLMLIEVDCPKRQWQVSEDVKIPGISEPAEVQWLGFRAGIPNPEILTNEERTSLLLRFNHGSQWRWYTAADSLFFQVDSQNRLIAVFIADIIDDIAGQRIAAFRKATSL